MKKPFYKIGSIVKEAALQQKGYLDPNRGKKLEDGTFGFYTDPTTKKKSTIEYERGNLGRTHKDAFDKRDMKTYGKMDLKQYTDFSKKQKAHYRTTGVWLSPDKMKEYEARDTQGRGTFVPPSSSNKNGNNNKQTTINSSGNETSTLKGIGTFKEFVDKNKGSENKINLNEPIKFDKIDLSGGKEAGLVRKFESQKGFSGDVLDKEIAKTTDAQSIRRYARGMKDKALSAGATRREAKHHKMLGKALGFAQDAGMVLKETDAKGNVVNESVGKKSTSIVGDGKARRKANRLMKRANRLAHRMKDYEGHNTRKDDVGGQYYGDKQKYNQITAGDQRDASRLSGGVNMIKNNLSGNNNSTIGNNATGLAGLGGGTVKYGSNVGKVDVSVAKTANITGKNKKQGAV